MKRIKFRVEFAEPVVVVVEDENGEQWEGLLTTQVVDARADGSVDDTTGAPKVDLDLRWEVRWAPR